MRQILIFIVNCMLMCISHAIPIDILDTKDRSNDESVIKTLTGMENFQNNDADIVELEEKNEENAEVVTYKYDNVGAAISKYREPEKGDTSSSLITYTLAETPEYSAFINGYRRNTVLVDGTTSGTSGANLELKSGPNEIKIGGEKADNAKDDHYLLLFHGKARILDLEDTQMDLTAKASRVVGGVDDAKTTLKINFGLQQKV